MVLAAVLVLSAAAWSAAARAPNQYVRLVDRARAESAAVVCAEAAALRRQNDPEYHTLPAGYPVPQPGQEVPWAMEATAYVPREDLPGGGACWPVALRNSQSLYGVGSATPSPFGPPAFVVRAEVSGNSVILQPLGEAER